MGNYYLPCNSGCDAPYPSHKHQLNHLSSLQWMILWALALTCFLQQSPAQIRDGNIDPANLGKGDWIYFLSETTNRLRGNVPWVTNEASLMQFYREQGFSWISVKAATSDQLFNGSYSTPQFTSNLVAAAHAEGIKIFGYNRSYGSNLLGEIAIADYVFQQGADGFIYDAEAEWESNRSWIGADGPAKAVALCSAVRSNWPTKFLAHAPLPIISYHSSFPYKEFGYWCDAVMPQDYWKSIGITPEDMVRWRDTEWRTWENGLSGIWTNAIKPLAPIGQGWSPSSSEIVTADEITRYFAALRTDADPPGPGPYSGVSFWRADLHTPEMWDAFRTNSLVDTTTNPPTITSQPQNITITAGATATFSVTAEGTAPLVYQWQKSGTNLPGATASAYTKTYAQTSDAGAYSVVITNRFGTAISSNAVLTVNVLPSITTQPESQWATVGDTVSFTITAQGTEALHYTWRKDGTNIAGATEATLTIQGVDDASTGSYMAVVSNAAGTVQSVLATLTVTPSPVAPFITQQPQDRRVPLGRSATLTVAAQGTTPLSYQWLMFGTNLPGATQNKLTIMNVASNNAGPYTVVITNKAGMMMSSNAILSIGNRLRTQELWKLAGGDRPYLGTGSQYERGMAYNKLTDRLLIVSRLGTTQIVVLDGSTGEDLYSLNIDPQVVNGGTYSLNMIGVADDGAVYAANLAPSGAGFKVYRWGSDSIEEMPAVAMNENPAPANIQRWGDTLDVRGAGTNTQILIGSRNGRAFAVLTTTNGATFSPTAFDLSEARDGGFGLGIAFGPNNTLYGKAMQFPLIRAGFDLSLGASWVIKSFESTEFPFAVSPIGVATARDLLAGIFFGTPDTLNLYDISIPDAPPIALSTNAFASDNVNSFYTGSVDFGGNRVYALDSNNGLLALELLVESEPVIDLQPLSRTVVEGTPVGFTVQASGSEPMTYQWQLQSTDIQGATSSQYVIPSPVTNDSGAYRVIVSNDLGATTSMVAILTVLPGITLAQALDQTALQWSTGGATNWFGQDVTSWDGVDAARSGFISDGESTYITATATGPATIRFWWKTSSEQSWDFLRFRVNTVEVAAISGETEWQQVSYDLPAGTNVMVWEYSKDSSASYGQDAGWLDRVSWFGPCTNCPPVIARQPHDVRGVLGAPAQLSVVAYGEEPMRFQWRLNGAALSGATTSLLTIPSITTTDEGSYSVVITNAFGIMASADAYLTVTLPLSQVADDFEPGLDPTQWFAFGDTSGTNIAANGYGGSLSPPNSLWFGSETNRVAVTMPVITTVDGIITYALHFGLGSRAFWETVDIPAEGVVFECSTNGGANWQNIATHNTAGFYDWTVVTMGIPPFAKSGATLFRWRQLAQSGTCCDQWAIDDVKILPGMFPPAITLHPRDATVKEGRNTIFLGGAWGTPPMQYQWYFNGQAISGATAATYSITNVASVNAGLYCFSVSNFFGFAVSSNALLDIIPKPPCLLAPSNLVAWWKAEGDTTDSAGVNDASFGNNPGPFAYSEGFVGLAFRLESSFLRCAYSAPLDVSNGPGLTIEGWISPWRISPAFLAGWSEISAPFRTGADLELWVVNGQPVLQALFTATNGLTKLVRSSVGLSVSNWHHVVLSYSRNTGLASLFLNGSAVLRTNIGSMNLVTKAAFTIGGRPLGGYNFNGLIDEISVYSRALDDAEVQGIYNAGFGGKCSPQPPSCISLPPDAVAWWRGESNCLDTVGFAEGLPTGGPPMTYTNGRVGLAHAFNGAYVTVPRSPNLDVGSASGMTVEGWVNLNSLYPSSPIFEWSSAVGSAGVGLMSVYSSALQATMIPDNSPTAKIFQTAGGTLNPGCWQHVALTYSKSNGTAVIYINAAEALRTNIGVMRPATMGDFFLGYRRASGRLYGGALDEFTVYRRALTAGEIASIALAKGSGKCVPAQVCEPPPSGLIGWWSGESNALSRVNLLNGTAVGVTYTAGKVGAAFEFGRNLSQAYVRVAASPTLNVGDGPGFAFETWVKQQLLADGPVFEWGDGKGTFGPSLRIFYLSRSSVSGTAMADIVDSDGRSHIVYSRTNAVALGSWNHLAVTYDKASGIAAVYVNGEVTRWNIGSFTPRTDLDLYLGSRFLSPALGANFAGSIDEPSLYNRALTEDEVLRIALTRSAGKCAETPRIVREAADLKVNEGETAVFEAQVSGTPPVSCQWRWNLFSILPGETNATLVLTNVSYSQHGVYHILATNIFGSVMSTGATLTVNRAPVASNQLVTAFEDAPVNIGLRASDPDHDSLSFVLLSGPVHGTLSGTPPNIVYTPTLNFWGTDAFQFAATDGAITSAPAVVVLSIAPVNDAPFAMAQTVTTDEDTSITISLTGSDPEDDPLTWSVGQPAHGTISGTPPNVTYAPATNYNGTDSFTFTVSDGSLMSAPASVTVTVNPASDAPVAQISISPLVEFPGITNLLIISTNGRDALVVLDGSGSSDADNQQLSYAWFDGTNWLATDALIQATYPIGSHEVGLLVSDGTLYGTNTASFYVITGADAVAILMELVQNSGLSAKQQQPLLASLRAALASFNRQNVTSALGQLEALKNKVEAQVGRINPELSTELQNAIDQILNAWDGPQLRAKPLVHENVFRQATSTSRGVER